MQVSETRWVPRPTPPSGGSPSPEVDEITFARALGTPPLVARLLLGRGLRTPAEARSFLSPRLADLRPPDDLPDIDVAARRLADAVRRRERITIFGDYDVDGMTGTALLVRFFTLAGADVGWAIPDRAGGYGLGPEAVDTLAEQGTQVIVTVDNGVSAHAAIERAASLGIDVVVTDHHLPAATLPPAVAVVDPHRRDASGEGRWLCGCALAFKLAWAVADRLRGTDDGARFKAFLRDGVGLAALATVADMMPLQGENRVLVAAGLTSVRATDHPGIQALLACARVGASPLTAEDVAFRIGPRLNAAGRLSRPGLVIDLLTADDAGTARSLARELEAANIERRRIEQGVLELAHQQADEAVAGHRGHSLVVHGEGWHVGVIGIVAARLVDRHHRPTVVVGFDGPDGRGSCRTPKTVDLHHALSSCSDHLTRFGGHAAAAGFEIRRDKIDAFADAFDRAVGHQLDGEVPLPTLEFDTEVGVDDIDLETVLAIERIGPFGEGNPAPQLVIRGAEVAGRARLMGQNDAHLTFALKQSGGAIRVVGFKMAHHHELVTSASRLDLVVTPMLNEWRGTRSAELRLVDVRSA